MTLATLEAKITMLLFEKSNWYPTTPYSISLVLDRVFDTINEKDVSCQYIFYFF